MSGIISAQPFNDYFPEILYNSTWQGFVTAIYEIGCLAGAIAMLLFGDALGRRKAIMIGASIMILGTIIQITPIKGHNAGAQFILGRTITGVGNGMNTATIPTYQAECSKTTNRGLLICIEGGVIAFGTLIAYWTDYGCSYGPDQLTWRFPIAFQIVFALIILVGPMFLPESPRWLLSKDRHEDAIKVIAALRGHNIGSEETRLEAHIIMDSLRASGHKGGNTAFSALFTNGKTQHFRRMMLGASSQLMQQIGGCNAVIYYFPILFEQSIKQSHEMSLLLGGVNMIVYSIFATTSWFIIERVGRRNLFLIGTVGQCKFSQSRTFCDCSADEMQAYQWSSYLEPSSQAARARPKVLLLACSHTLRSSALHGCLCLGCILPRSTQSRRVAKRTPSPRART